MQDIGKSPRVLTVEDDADIYRLLYKILKKTDIPRSRHFPGRSLRPSSFGLNASGNDRGRAEYSAGEDNTVNVPRQQHPQKAGQGRSG